MADRPERNSSQPLSIQYSVGVNILTLRELLALDPKWFYKVAGLLTPKEAQAFLASSDRLIELLRADTIHYEGPYDDQPEN